MNSSENTPNITIETIKGKQYACLPAKDCLHYSKHRYELVRQIVSKLGEYVPWNGPILIDAKSNDPSLNGRSLELAINKVVTSKAKYLAIPKSMWNRCSTEQQESLIKIIEDFREQVVDPHYEMRHRIKNFLQKCTECPIVEADPKAVEGPKHRLSSRIEFAYKLPAGNEQESRLSNEIFDTLENAFLKILEESDKPIQPITQATKYSEGGDKVVRRFSIKITQGELNSILQNDALREKLEYAATHPDDPLAERERMIDAMKPVLEITVPAEEQGKMRKGEVPGRGGNTPGDASSR